MKNLLFISAIILLSCSKDNDVKPTKNPLDVRYVEYFIELKSKPFPSNMLVGGYVKGSYEAMEPIGGRTKVFHKCNLYKDDMLEIKAKLPGAAGAGLMGIRFQIGIMDNNGNKYYEVTYKNSETLVTKQIE